MPVIAQKVSATYPAPVSIRKLLALLAAFAVLFAPFATQSGAAMAMAPADHQAQMMKAGHCSEQPSKGHPDKPMGKSCCTSMFAAVVIAPSRIVEPLHAPHSAKRPAVDLFQRNFLAELPTPPPRVA